MSFVQRELDRIGNALRQAQPDNRYDELYATQQALLWALEPGSFKSPYDMLVAAKSTQEDLGGCPEGSGRSRSSGIPDHRAS